MIGIPNNLVPTNMFAIVNVCISFLLFFCSVLLTECCKLILEAAQFACADPKHELGSTRVQRTSSRK